jgi:HK97 family phage major capsid protein
VSDYCEHGFRSDVCNRPPCHAAVPDDANSAELLDRYTTRHRGKPKAELARRRSECITRAAQLREVSARADSRGLSRAQRDECNELAAEQLVIDELIMEADVAIRAETIEGIKRAAMDPANLEAGWDQGPAGRGEGAPALVKNARRDRLETPDEVLQRCRSNPWRQDGGPLDRETGAGLASRAHSAIEALDNRFPHEGAEKLAELLSLRSSTFGPYEKRDAEDIRRSAELVLALSNPFYESAFRSILKYPEAFRNGTGMLLWSDQERLAYSDVMACRAALIEDSGTGGMYLLPLVLDSQIMITNAGSANPWRRVCRNVTTTAKAWNGVTSAGTTANWVAEGVAVTDTTPTIGQLVISPFKESVWMMASFEETADTQIAQQVPALLADGFDRLEEAAFTTGGGSTAPAGAITRATVGSNTGLVNVANGPAVFTLLSDLPVRFRVGDQAKPYWVANIAIINLLRAVAPFAAATSSIVNDSTSDGIPEIFGYDLLESTTMDASNATGGHKNLLFFDANSFIICQRLGTTVVYEPLVPGAGGILPAGVAGWYGYRRVSSDTSTATSLRVHNNA